MQSVVLVHSSVQAKGGDLDLPLHFLWSLALESLNNTGNNTIPKTITLIYYPTQDPIHPQSQPYCKLLRTSFYYRPLIMLLLPLRTLNLLPHHSSQVLPRQCQCVAQRHELCG